MLSSGALLRSDCTFQPPTALQELPAAGLAQAATITAKDALTWDATPATPEHLKPYQHYARQPPGSITRHFGTGRDAVPRDKVAGMKTKASQQSAADCMASYPDSEIGRWKLEQSEYVYSSTRQAPLGQAPSRHYNLPEGLGTTRPCGKPLHVREQEAKNSTQHIIFPQGDAGGTDPSTHKLYVASHRSFAPGEQQVWGYDWSKASIDPSTHRFGLVDQKGRQGSMKQLMQPDLEGGSPKPVVVSELYARHKATLGDTLGRPRVLGAAPVTQLPPNHVFGKPSVREQEPCACELLRGAYTQEQQLPDPGLGKSMTRWQHSKPRPEDSSFERVFGLPSVRTDIPLPARRSVADTQNYGNEPTAGQLLAPPKCVDLGVKEEHLLQLRSREEMLALLTEARIGMEDEEFQAVFVMAAATEGFQGPQQQCRLESFMAARQQYLRQLVGM